MRTIAVKIILLFALGGCGPVIWTIDKYEKAPEQFDGALLSYFFARGEMTVSAAYTVKDGLTITSEQTAKAVPDLRHQHALAYSHGALSTDEINIQFDGALLKKLSSTTKDQSIAAVQAVNALLTQIAATETALKLTSTTVDKPKEQCADAKVNALVDVTYGTYSKTIQQASRGATGGTPTDAVVNCTIRMEVNLKPPISTLGVVGFPSSINDVPTEDACNRAVCFRLGGVFPISATATLIGPDGRSINSVSTPQIYVLAPRRDAVGFVRFNRRAFVENMTSITFSNGIVSEFAAKNPSEVVGFLQLPTELLKSVVLTVPLVR